MFVYAMKLKINARLYEPLGFTRRHGKELENKRKVYKQRQRIKEYKKCNRILVLLLGKSYKLFLKVLGQS